MFSSKLLVIIDQDHQPWLDRRYIHKCRPFVSDQVCEQYHLLTGLPPVRSFTINSDGINFVITDNKWIRLRGGKSSVIDNDVIRVAAINMSSMISLKTNHQLYLNDTLLKEGIRDYRVINRHYIIAITTDDRIVLYDGNQWIEDYINIDKPRLVGANIISGSGEVYSISCRSNPPQCRQLEVPLCLDYQHFITTRSKNIYIDLNGKLWLISINGSSTRIKSELLKGKKLNHMIGNGISSVIVVDQSGDNYCVFGRNNGTYRVIRTDLPKLLTI